MGLKHICSGCLISGGINRVPGFFLRLAAKAKYPYLIITVLSLAIW